jgi:Tol biopolymer transport system component
VSESAWSADGAWIAFNAGTDLMQPETIRLYRIRPDGTAWEALTTVPSGSPTWSPDSQELAYATADGLMVLHIARKQARLVVAHAGMGQISWSPGRTHYICSTFAKSTWMTRNM